MYGLPLITIRVCLIIMRLCLMLLVISSGVESFCRLFSLYHSHSLQRAVLVSFSQCIRLTLVLHASISDVVQDISAHVADCSRFFRNPAPLFMLPFCPSLKVQQNSIIYVVGASRWTTVD